MKKTIAITLCLVLMISVLFTGCGKSESIAGTWTASIDVSDMMNEAIAAGDESIAEYMNFTDITLALTMIFTEDGTCSFIFDENSIEAMMEDVVDQMVPAMDTMMQEMMGMSLDDLLTLSGMSEDEWIESIMVSVRESMDMTSMNLEANYMIDNGILYTTDSLDVAVSKNSASNPYTLEGDTLTIGAGESDGDMAFLFPLVLKKAG